ncbi:MAG: hypothetical protein KGH71_06290, partial [Candidatus Micrarchaeota archaeon]|nr:hypothetical protein [Candidatus Micrarchaeota archaeon]
MDNMHYLLVGLVLVAIILSGLSYMKLTAAAPNTQNQSTSLSSIDTVLLQGQTIPAGSYIHLMDISPEQVVIG